MKAKQLNHVALHVANVEKSCVFYQDILLLEPIARPAFDFPGAWFRLGVDQELHLIGGRNCPTYSASRGNHFALLVEDIQAWERQLVKTGTHFEPMKIRPDGAYQIFVPDPDGHYVEICTVPGMAAPG